MSDQQQTPEQEAGKELKKFEKYMKSLVAILGGESLLKRSKARKPEIITAMEDLVKEEKEAKVAEIKSDIKTLVKSYVDFDAFQKQQKQAFDKAVNDKRKEFNKSAEGVFKKIEGLQSLEQSYYAALQGASTSPAPEAEVEPQNEEN